MTMRILLADDTAKVRFALRVLLERQPGLRVVGEAIDADELLTMAEAVCPNLILLDWELPGLGPTLTLLELRTHCPETKIIALSSRPEAHKTALAAGVDEFVSKSIPPDHLLEVIFACRNQVARIPENL